MTKKLMQMPSLKDYGIELRSFAPIPNSIIVGTFDFDKIDLATLQQIGKNIQAAFDEQGANYRLVFIPNNVSLQRLEARGLYEIRKTIDEIIKGCKINV